MSYWSTSTGEAVNTNSTSFEIEGGGNFAPIPAGTKVLAIIEGAQRRTVKDSHEEYVEIKWTILRPEPYKNRKIFQKVWCLDYDPNVTDPAKAKAKRDKALKMLAAIDTNAGGLLQRSGEEPNDMALASALVNKQMVIGLNTWDDRETKKPAGNWVYFVAEKTAEISVVTAEDVKKQQESISSKIDDEIPFN